MYDLYVGVTVGAYRDFDPFYSDDIDSIRGTILHLLKEMMLNCEQKIVFLTCKFTANAYFLFRIHWRKNA